MSKGRTFANDLLKLIYNATAIANIADNAAASPFTSVHWALHSAIPGETDTQDANEITYTGYGRVAVARSGAGHTVTNDQVSPAATVTFGQCTVGSTTAYFFSTGQVISGATKLFHKGVLGSRLGPFTAKADDNITIPGLTGVAVDDRITFFTTSGSSLPTGMTEGTVYWVLTVSTDDITISTTQGGSAVNLTTAGDGIAYRVTPLAISPGVTPQLTTSTTIYEE